MAVEVGSEVMKVVCSGVICSTEVIIVTKSLGVMLLTISVDMTVTIVLVLCSVKM